MAFLGNVSFHACAIKMKTWKNQQHVDIEEYHDFYNHAYYENAIHCDIAIIK